MRNVFVLTMLLLMSGCNATVQHMSDPVQNSEPNIIAVHSQSLGGIYLGESLSSLRLRFYVSPYDTTGKTHICRVSHFNRPPGSHGNILVRSGRVVGIIQPDSCAGPSIAAARFETTRRLYDITREYRDYAGVSAGFETVLDGQRIVIDMSYSDGVFVETWSYSCVRPLTAPLLWGYEPPTVVSSSRHEPAQDRDDGPADGGESDGPVGQP
jgi:hypothetical protein